MRWSGARRRTPGLRTVASTDGNAMNATSTTVPSSGRSESMYHKIAVLATGPIYKISYDLSQDYLKFVVRSTYDSDLKRAKISLRNIVS